MKIFIIICLISIPSILLGQWQGTNPIYFNSGNVGIGTATPGALLDIKYSGFNNLYRATDQNGQYRWRVDQIYNMLLSNSSGTDIVNIGQSGSWFNSGNVGIGTTTPLNGLSIFNLNNFNSGSIRFGHSGMNDGVLSLGYNSSTGRDALKLSYFPHSSTSSQTDLMTLDVNGDVGIGTTTPQERLHVEGNIYVNTNQVQFLSSNGGVNRIQSFMNNINSVAGTWQFKSRFDDIAIDAGENAGNERRIRFRIAGVERMFVDTNGNVGIGNTNPDAKLSVSGQVHAQEVKVTVSAPGPDYVFEKGYALPSLEEIKTYIDQNKHLPEVPSAKEMEKNGVQLGEMNMLLLKKIEELTLYLVELKKENEQSKVEIQKMQSEINQLKNNQ